MQKLLATSTAAQPTGSPPRRKLLRVRSGLYKGRLAALYADSPSGIALQHADNPYESWSAPLTVTSDSGDHPFSACIDDSGNIYLAYVDSSNHVKCIKLSFSSGVWTVGSPSTVVNVDDNYSPFIVKDSDGKLWCFFANRQTSSDNKYLLRVKSSADDGATWGSGPADLGTSLSAAFDDPCYVTSFQNGSDLFALYCVGRSALKIRKLDLSGVVWGPEFAILSSDYIDSGFDAVASGDGRIGLAFVSSESGKIYFKEFDGLTWGGLIEIESGAMSSPQAPDSAKTSRQTELSI